MGQCDRELQLTAGTTWSVLNLNRPCRFHLRFATSEEINSAADSSYTGIAKLSYMQNIQCPANPVPKRVKCIDTGEIFSSIQLAADSLGVSNSAITAAIQSPHLCKGYTFCFVGQFNSNEDEHSHMIEVRRRSAENSGRAYWKGKDLDSAMPKIQSKSS